MIRQLEHVNIEAVYLDGGGHLVHWVVFLERLERRVRKIVIVEAMDVIRSLVYVYASQVAVRQVGRERGVIKNVMLTRSEIRVPSDVTVRHQGVTVDQERVNMEAVYRAGGDHPAHRFAFLEPLERHVHPDVTVGAQVVIR